MPAETLAATVSTVVPPPPFQTLVGAVTVAAVAPMLIKVSPNPVVNPVVPASAIVYACAPSFTIVAAALAGMTPAASPGQVPLLQSMIVLVRSIIPGEDVSPFPREPDSNVAPSL